MKAPETSAEIDRNEDARIPSLDKYRDVFAGLGYEATQLLCAGDSLAIHRREDVARLNRGTGASAGYLLDDDAVTNLCLALLFGGQGTHDDAEALRFACGVSLRATFSPLNAEFSDLNLDEA